MLKQIYWQIYCNAILEQTNQPFTVQVNSVERTKLYNNNTITEGCAGTGEQFLYLFSTSNMMTSRSITVKVLRGNNTNDVCQLNSFNNTSTGFETSVNLEENKTVIRTFVTSYIQGLSNSMCDATFKYVNLKFKVYIYLKVLVINMIRILFNITILLMLILFIYSLKLLN